MPSKQSVASDLANGGFFSSLLHLTKQLEGLTSSQEVGYPHLPALLLYRRWWSGEANWMPKTEKHVVQEM